MAMAPGLTTFVLVCVVIWSDIPITDAATPSSSSSHIITATAKGLPCSDQAAINAMYSTIIGQNSYPTSIDCVRACLEEGRCIAAARITGMSSVSSTCVLLGGISSRPVTLSVGSGAKCTLYLMNPCPVDGLPFRGQCQCPKGTAGQFCQLANPDDCFNGWTKVYSNNGTWSPDAVINANKATNGGYLKAGLRQNDGSLLILHSAYFFTQSDTFAAQVVPTLTRKSWNEFKDDPIREFRFALSSGTVHSFKADSNTITSTQIVTDWFMRQPHVNRFLYSNGASGGSVDDLIKAVQNGQDIVTYNAAHVQPEEGKAQFSRYQYEISRSSGYMYQSKPYWFNSKRTSDGAFNVLRFYIVSQAFVSTSNSLATNQFHVDVCWTPASQPNGNGDSMGQLWSALFNGHAVRVLVDATALAVNQVEVVGDVVVFGGVPYLTPLGPGPYTQSSQLEYVVATTNQTVYTCKSLLPASSPVTNTTTSATVKWFVDTRHRTRIFSVTSDGEVLHGSEASLISALSLGASLTVGLIYSDPNHYLLLTIKTLELTPEGHVVAMAEGLTRLPIQDGQLTSWQECGLRSWLMTSQGSVTIYTYKRGHQGYQSVLTGLTIDWFVDAYKPN